MLALVRSLSRIRYIFTNISYDFKNYFLHFRSSRLLFNNFSSTSKLCSDYEQANDLGFKNHYSAIENDKILNAINQRSLQDMRNFNISQLRLDRIIQRREKFGEFRSVEDLLEVEGFGIKILEKFCNSILKADVDQNQGDGGKLK